MAETCCKLQPEILWRLPSQLGTKGYLLELYMGLYASHQEVSRLPVQLQRRARRGVEASGTLCIGTSIPSAAVLAPSPQRYFFMPTEDTLNGFPRISQELMVCCNYSLNPKLETCFGVSGHQYQMSIAPSGAGYFIGFCAAVCTKPATPATNLKMQHPQPCNAIRSKDEARKPEGPRPLREVL